ncbi:MAG: cyclohydrolase [Bacteroidetes bacterium]|jgi:hypothetical protein|nr:cyclohydrolase [Bacteroidota bacterium]
MKKVLPLLLLFSCSSPEEIKVNKPISDTLLVKTEIPVSDSIDQIPRKKFDVEKFTHQVDSLLKLIEGKRTMLQVSSHTVQTGKDLPHFKATSTNTIVIHSFKAGAHWALNFRIIEATFNDKNKLEEAFSSLWNDAMDLRKGDEKFSPGLSYTNDYVIKTDEAIFWLNLSCAYAGKNGAKIEKLWRSSLSLGKITDSIVCSCGQSWCNEKNSPVIPNNLHECSSYFDRNLSESLKDSIKATPENLLTGRYHKSLGMFIRNNWIRDSRSPQLVKFFQDRGVTNPDDISFLIIKRYWCNLNSKYFDEEAEIKKYQDLLKGKSNTKEVTDSVLTLPH